MAGVVDRAATSPDPDSEGPHARSLDPGHPLRTRDPVMPIVYRTGPISAGQSSDIEDTSWLMIDDALLPAVESAHDGYRVRRGQ
jgi:hypothetical protein